MEHLLRLASSNSLFYASVFVFIFGLILWFVWARFFHERDAFKRVSQLVMLVAAQMLFVGGYASAVTNGLDGVACAAGRSPCGSPQRKAAVVKVLNLVAFVLARVRVGHVQFHLAVKLYRLPHLRRSTAWGGALQN